MTLSRKARVFWPLAVSILVGDYVSKHAAAASLAPPGTPHDVVGTAVRLTLSYNRGAAMGLPLGSHSAQALGFLGLVVVVVLFVWYRRTAADELLLPAALGLLVAGALGNAWQRLLSPGGVVDFIDVGVGTLRFWTFNVADAGLTVGVGLLVIYMWLEGRGVEGGSPDG